MMEIVVGHCYCRRNPLWGRDVVRVNRQVQSSVLDFERYDVTIIRTSEGLELHEHQIVPATVFTHTGYEPIKEELYFKLLAMAKMTQAVSHAKNLSQSSNLHDELDANIQQQVESLLRDYGVIDDTPMQSYAEAYDKGMKNLLDGVYDVVDVHK